MTAYLIAVVTGSRGAMSDSDSDATRHPSIHDFRLDRLRPSVCHEMITKSVLR
jgi:hypothetical protein